MKLLPRRAGVRTVKLHIPYGLDTPRGIFWGLTFGGFLWAIGVLITMGVGYLIPELVAWMLGC